MDTIADFLSIQTVAQLCRCHRPHDPNQYPRVKFAKQYSPERTDQPHTLYGCVLQDFMKEYDVPVEAPPETTNPPDFTRPPRDMFRPLHHNTMNAITLSRPSWASKVYESSFETSEPTNNSFTPKRFSYAAAAKKSNQTNQSKTTTKTSSSPKTASPETSPPKPIPATAPSNSSQNPTISTLTPNSEMPQQTAAVTPPKPVPAHCPPKFVQETEQHISDVNREMMELRTSRQAMGTRVVQIERNQDTLSKQIQELTATSKLILERMDDKDSANGMSVTNSSLSQASKRPQKPSETLSDTESEPATHEDFRNFQKKIKSYLTTTFTALDNDFNKRFEKMEDRLVRQIQMLASRSDDNADESTDIIMYDETQSDETTTTKTSRSADHTTSTDSTTATSQSPPKKQKGSPGSGSG